MYKTPADRSVYLNKASDQLLSLKNSRRYGQTTRLRRIFFKEKNYEESKKTIKKPTIQ